MPTLEHVYLDTGNVPPSRRTPQGERAVEVGAVSSKRLQTTWIPVAGSAPETDCRGITSATASPRVSE
jgi:hypothetical protein